MAFLSPIYAKWKRLGFTVGVDLVFPHTLIYYTLIENKLENEGMMAGVTVDLSNFSIVGQ